MPLGLKLTQPAVKIVSSHYSQHDRGDYKMTCCGQEIYCAASQGQILPFENKETNTE